MLIAWTRCVDNVRCYEMLCYAMRSESCIMLPRAFNHWHLGSRHLQVKIEEVFQTHLPSHSGHILSCAWV